MLVLESQIYVVDWIGIDPSSNRYKGSLLGWLNWLGGLSVRHDRLGNASIIACAVLILY